MGSYTLPGRAWYSMDELCHFVISVQFEMPGSMVDMMGRILNYMA